ncbi:MAG TPA: NADH-quinone oxidoreductase subunit C [Candidatus Acidoferrales bacterium]|nr:NADH-quinone oxidoreductase subunit C [Candidatus Acidoferrales bacterium]
MSSALERLASGAGLVVKWRSGDEAWADCPEGEFRDRVGALVGRATLSDLFATTTPPAPPRLTAVLQMAGDPAWLLLTSELGAMRFPSLTPEVHAASWYEREILEMHGLEPVGHPAPDRLRLHSWPVGHRPMRDRPAEVGRFPHPPHVRPRLAVTGQGVFQLPLGPVRSGPQESAEFLFFSGGEDIVELEVRLGFKYRAIEKFAEGQPADRALQLAERLAGTSGFANGLAFTRAVERAVGVSVGPTAEHTRALLGELERLYNHFGTIGRLAEATGLLVAAAQYSLLKEEALRAAGRLTGHRYLRGVLRIGGLELGLAAGARDQLRAQLDEWRERSEGLRRLLEQTSTFVDRLDTTAILLPDYASEHNLVGPVGRASGIDRDVRRDHPYAAYGSVEFDVPTVADGDAEARFQVHAAELAQSLTIMRQLLAGWPSGAEQPVAPRWRAGSGLGWAEAPGGETLHWVDLDQEGRVLRWRARPPAVVNWHPFAHACGSGNNLTDYPVIEASFSISPAEFDR